MNIDQHPLAHWVCDPSKSAIVRANNALTTRLGLPDGALDGRKLSEVLTPRCLEELKPGEPPTGGLALVDADGNTVSMVAHVVPNASSDGVLTALVETDNALQQSLDEIRLAFADMAENVPGAMFEYTLNPDGVDEVDYVSSGCREVWELEPEAIEHDATRIWELVHEEDIPGLQQSIEASAATLEPWFYEWRITTPSGRFKWLQGVGRPRRKSDGRIVWNSVILDITDKRLAAERRHELEHQLRQANKLESLGRLAGGVTHDFNNMLTVIMSAAEAGARAVNDPEMSRELFEDILEAAKRSSKLTQQFLSIARFDSTEDRLTDVCEHIRATTPLLRRLASSMVGIELELAEDLPAARIASYQLDQILTNLVANARDAMPRGGMLKISARKLENEGVLVEVVDEGTGMDETTLAKVYEPFFTTKPMGKGNGLGLPTVHRIVQRIGGRISIDSTEGEGTRVSVSLPAETNETINSFAPIDASAEPLDRGCALVVEEEFAVRRVLQRHLQARDFEVQSASSVDEAKNLWNSNSCGLLILDAASTMFAGVHFAQMVRTERPQLPIVYLVGREDNVELMQALRALPAVELTKPFTLAQLDQAIVRAVSHHDQDDREVVG